MMRAASFRRSYERILLSPVMDASTSVSRSHYFHIVAGQAAEHFSSNVN
jgi:hypothetical protein